MTTTSSDFFKGRSVLITGGSSGLGLALAQALAAREAQLLLVARDGARLAAAAQSIVARHPACSPRTVTLDVGDPRRAFRQSSGTRCTGSKAARR